MEVNGLLHTPSRFNPRETVPDTHETECCMGPREGLDTGVEYNLIIVLGIEPRFLSRTVCSLVVMPMNIYRKHLQGTVVYPLRNNFSPRYKYIL
jgi:hypothetical protein